MKASQVTFLGRVHQQSLGRHRVPAKTIDSAYNDAIALEAINQFCEPRPLQRGHPHNMPIQMLQSWGLPAALAAFYLIARL